MLNRLLVILMASVCLAITTQAADEEDFEYIPTAADIARLNMCSYEKTAEKFMMWRIEKDEHFAHLVGSLHLGPDDLYPMPAVITNTFLESDVAVFEINSELLDIEFNKKAYECGLLPEGKKLSDLLDADTSAALDTALKKIHYSMKGEDGTKPWMVALKLTFSYTWRAPGVLSINNGIDRYFTGLAKINRKKIRGLETPDDQLDLFKSIDNELGVEFLKKTLQELSQLEAIVTEMADAWKNGDIDTLWSIVNESFAAYPDVYKKWIVERNHKWVDVIDQLFEDKTRAFITVGAAHVCGPDSLQTLLTARGYNVEQTINEAFIPTP